MVGDREGARLRHVEDLAAVLEPHADQAGLAQRAIDMDRRRDRRDAVFGEHDHARAVARRIVDEVARDRVDLGEALGDPRIVGPEALQVVVEMRQVDERQGRGARAAHMQGGIGDPARRHDRGRGSPEAEQRKGAELLRQLVAQRDGLGVAVRQLAPVRLVDRPRRHADVVARAHVVPPEHIGGGEIWIAPLAHLPDLLAVDQAVRLAPEPDLHQVAEQPAVRHDAMLARQRAGHECRLHGAGDGGRHGRERTDRAGARPMRQAAASGRDDPASGPPPAVRSRDAWPPSRRIERHLGSCN